MPKLFGFALLLCLAVPLWADKPPCVDPITGLPVDRPGACFVTWQPGIYWVALFTPDGSVGAGPLDQKQFDVVHKDTVHAFNVDQDINILFCPNSLSAICPPPPSPPPAPGTVYAGAGHVVANLGTPSDTSLGCPTTVHLQGIVKAPDPSTSLFRMDAVVMTVKDKDSPDGCRLVISQVTLKPR